MSQIKKMSPELHLMRYRVGVTCRSRGYLFEEPITSKLRIFDDVPFHHQKAFFEAMDLDYLKNYAFTALIDKHAKPFASLLACGILKFDQTAADSEEMLVRTTFDHIPINPRLVALYLLHTGNTIPEMPMSVEDAKLLIDDMLSNQAETRHALVLYTGSWYPLLIRKLTYQSIEQMVLESIDKTASAYNIGLMYCRLLKSPPLPTEAVQVFLIMARMIAHGKLPHKEIFLYYASPIIDKISNSKHPLRDKIRLLFKHATVKDSREANEPTPAERLYVVAHKFAGTSTSTDRLSTFLTIFEQLPTELRHLVCIAYAADYGSPMEDYIPTKAIQLASTFYNLRMPVEVDDPDLLAYMNA